MSFIITVNKIIAVVRGGANRVIGGDIFAYERAYGNLDFTSDNDIPNLRAVKALIGSGGLAQQEISVPAGSPIPLVTDMTVDPYDLVQTEFIAQVELLDAPYATYQNSKTIYDVSVEKNYTDNTHTALTTVSIYGHPSDADPTITQDDLKVLLR